MGRSVLSGDRILLLIASSDPHTPLAWRRLADGASAGSGDDALAAPAAEGEERVVLLVPAADVTINWAELPDLAPAQARGAARLLAAENSVAPLDTLHVAVGDGEADAADRLIATVDRAKMADWLARAQSLGLDPELALPVSLLVPRPDAGFVRADVLGQTVLRSHNSAFADDPALTPLIVGDAPVTVLDAEAADAALRAALDSPPLNLRQDAFARRKRWQVDWPLIRRLGAMAAGVLLLMLLINLVLILKYNSAADAMELRTRALAQSAVPGLSGDANAEAALEDALAASRGGGAGFAATASAIYTAVRAVPNLELTLFDFGVDGSLRITLSAATPEDIAAFQRQLERYGFDGTATAPRVEAGRQMVEMTVKLP